MQGPSQSSRQSETGEQHAYEQRIYDEQLSDSTASLDDHMAKMSVSDQHEREERGLLRRFKDQIKRSFPEAVTDLKIMGGITALESRVKKELTNSELFPEVNRVAHVRRGLDLCPDELAFLEKRKIHTRESFARYLGLDPDDVHPDDVPVCSLGGSGGGFRAMIGLLGYAEQMKRSGLWDCLTYVSGVSGSCWSLAAYFTFGGASMANVIEHCKKRFSPLHPLSGDAIRTVLTAPGGAHVTLGPLIQKSKSGLQTVAMDLYSVFTTGWIFFQDDPASHPGSQVKRVLANSQRSWYRYTSARQYVDSGAEPLPIMTAVRHERPWRDWHDKEHPFKDPDHASGDHQQADEAWFQWFEMTPFEVGCDEISAWVPTWAFGRPFEGGKSVMQLPEQSLALLLGLCTSAPAGPLTSYVATIARNLPNGFLGNSIHSLAHSITRFWGKRGTEQFEAHHPLHPCNEHNFMYHFTETEIAARPPGLENSPRIHLIDAGMDNNCPTYVLLHPRREADVLIAMDASSDVQKDTFPERVAQIGGRRGLKFTRREDVRPGDDARDPRRFEGLYAQIFDGVPCARPDTVVDSYGRTVKTPPAEVYPHESTVVYMPLLPNEAAVPGYDPSTAKFSGSYNLVWTPEQVEMLVKVCAANFEAGEPTLKQALREAWLRKKARREKAEKTS